MIFRSVAEYIEAVRGNPGLAMLPMGLVAELKGISRSAVAEQIKTGALEAVEVKGKRKTWRGVLPAGLFAQTDRAEKHVRDRRAKVAAALSALATAGRTGTYGEVMEPAGMSPRNPRHRAEIGALLADLSRESLVRHGYLIGAVAVQKASGLPNALFFDLARDLGVLLPGVEEPEFWRDQCDRAFAHHVRQMAEAAD
ncbi:MAG: hypothetical protein AB1918_10120 [Pseudomonadota bacterium]